MQLLHREAKVPHLDDRHTHLLNFIYLRSRDPMYTTEPIRDLRRYEAPILYVIFPNNESFKRSVIYQGAIAWNACLSRIG